MELYIKHLKMKGYTNELSEEQTESYYSLINLLPSPNIISLCVKRTSNSDFMDAIFDLKAAAEGKMISEQ